jgi:hypothetical protein
LEYADDASYLSDDIIMIKSPLNGVLVFKHTIRDEFMPVRTISIESKIFDRVSQICCIGEYLATGESATGKVIVKDIREPAKDACRKVRLLGEGRTVEHVIGLIKGGEMIMFGIDKR